MGAKKQTAERKLMFLVAGFIMSVQNILHTLEQCGADNGRMLALVLFSIPFEISQVKGIAQNAIVDMAFGDELAGFRSDDGAKMGQRAVAFCIELKNPLSHDCILRMDLDGVLNLVVAVAKRRASGIDTLGSFFLHALFDFFAQILDVVAGNKKLKTVHQFRLRLGILADDLALFGKMDFNAKVFDRDTVAEVTIQAVGLFDQHHAAFRVLLKELDHLAKLFAARILGCFHVHEFTNDFDLVLEGILAQHF